PLDYLHLFLICAVGEPHLLYQMEAFFCSSLKLFGTTGIAGSIHYTKIKSGIIMPLLILLLF
ncbi:MAG: hypothetical protein VB120_07755, partial [Lachnospiraceae bacterium]|nr:hypothetical protein [Lachnospiraceae bacterium]